LGRRRATPRDVDAELAFHLERKTEELIAEGMPPDQARAAARAAFGDLDEIRAECTRIRAARDRERRRRDWFAHLGRDARAAFLALVRAPGYSAAAVFSLALGFGAITIGAAAVRGVVLRPVPYESSDRLVRLAHQRGHDDVGFSPPEVRDLRAAVRTLDAIVEYHSMSFVLHGIGAPERVQAGIVSHDFFEIVGVDALLGAAFTADDDLPGGEPVLLLGYAFWQRRFRGDPSVVGRRLEMNGRPIRVSGVLPPLPGYPDPNDVFLPLAGCPFRSDPEWSTGRGARGLTVLGRLRPEANLAAARGDLAAVATASRAMHPSAYAAQEAYGVDAVRLRADVAGAARPPVVALFGMAGLLLAIACSNAAILTGARRRRSAGTAGEPESAFDRRHVFEGSLLALGAWAVGLLWGHGALPAVIDFFTRLTPSASQMAIDGHVIAFGTAVAATVALVVAWLPTALGRHGHPAIARLLRRMVLGGQVAVCAVLLVGAGLLVRSFFNLVTVHPGFDGRDVVTARIDLNWAVYDDEDAIVGLFDSVDARLRADPRVREVAIAHDIPLAATDVHRFAFRIGGQRDSAWHVAHHRSVSPAYFEALRIPIVAGRGFTDADHQSRAPVVLVNQTMAQRFWPGESPVGRRLWPDNGEELWHEIVGVVGDVRHHGLDQPPVPEAYGNFSHDVYRDFRLLVATADPVAAEAAVRDAVRAIDPRQPVSEFRTIGELRGAAFGSRRTAAVVFALFGVVALGIAVTGIWGAAFSARPLADVLAPAALGAATGLALAPLLTPSLSPELFGVTPTDAATFGAVGILMILTVIGAGALPAHRAAHPRSP
jgi:predicted permease